MISKEIRDEEFEMDNIPDMKSKKYVYFPIEKFDGDYERECGAALFGDNPWALRRAGREYAPRGEFLLTSMLMDDDFVDILYGYHIELV